MPTKTVKYPQFINMDADIKARYLDPVVNDPVSFFYKRELGEAYLMAAVLGFTHKQKKPTTKTANIRVFDNWQDQYKVLFRVLAASENKYDLDILLDGSKTLKIVEEYANAGALLLHQEAINIANSEGLQKLIWDKIKEANTNI